MDSRAEQIAKWLETLRHAPELFPHPVSQLRLLETHISWLLLTGDYVYKFKKPVDFGFLDFSTLPRRRQACLDELRLNRRLAPQLYVDVIAIGGSEQAPRLPPLPSAAENSPPVPLPEHGVLEYAVRMRQFPAGAQLDERLQTGALGSAELKAFAATLAAFHDAAPSAGRDTIYGEAEHVHGPVQRALDDLLRRSRGQDERAAVIGLQNWAEAQRTALAAVLPARKSAGHIVEGHGDLHLANLVWLDGAIRAFDCLEFNAALRWGDAICDAAFLYMDLLYRQRQDLAYTYLNAYLEQSGDYEGLRVLPYYAAYRAIVRAQIAMIRRDGDAPGANDAHTTEIHAYLRLAQKLTVIAPVRLILMHGPSGSGKTHCAAALLQRLPAIRIRSDVERKRLLGLAPLARSPCDTSIALYSRENSRATYARLKELAHSVLHSGASVIVDAAFLERWQRDLFYALAESLGISCAILACTAPTAELERRINHRAAAGCDASDADVGVLARQLARCPSLGADELATTIRIDTQEQVDYTTLCAHLRDAVI